MFSRTSKPRSISNPLTERVFKESRDAATPAKAVGRESLACLDSGFHRDDAKYMTVCLVDKRSAIGSSLS